MTIQELRKTKRYKWYYFLAKIKIKLAVLFYKLSEYFNK